LVSDRASEELNPLNWRLPEKPLPNAPTSRRTNSMECSLSTVYALSLMEGIDPEDLRYGQLLTLAVGVSLVLAGHLLLSILS
jgi:hypothetical protein